MNDEEQTSSEEQTTMSPQENSAPGQDVLERISRLEAELEAATTARQAAERELAERREQAGKEAALAAVGIPATYSRFLTGQPGEWAEQASALQALASPAPASVPRDPAVDAEPEDNGWGRSPETFFYGRRS